MKKKSLLYSALMVLIVSTNCFQMSCSKEATAQSNTQTQAGKILFTRSSGSGANFNQEVWLADYNGSNQQRVNFDIPAEINQRPIELSALLSPDGQTIFITFHGYGIYKCKPDGSNLQAVMKGERIDLEWVN